MPGNIGASKSEIQKAALFMLLILTQVFNSF